METKPEVEGWAILELMGHRRLAGFVREVVVAGAGCIRIDIPGDEMHAAATQYYAPGSMYCLTPTTEAIARSVARGCHPEPASRWELLPPPSMPYTPDKRDATWTGEGPAPSSMHPREEEDDG